MPVICTPNNTQLWNPWYHGEYEANIAEIIKGYLRFLIYGQYYVTDSNISRVRIVLARKNIHEN